MSHGFTIINQNRCSILAQHVRVAANSRERRRGLLDLRNVNEDFGLWINPCEAIHTFGMKMPIDSIFIDKHFQVRKLRSYLRPGRIAICLSAASVLELPVGTILRSRTAVGDRLRFSSSNLADA